MTPPSPTSSALTGLPLQKNQNTVNFVGNTGSEVYNSVVVRGNFVVAGGQNNWPTTMYNQQAAGSLISGAAAPVFNNSGWGGGSLPPLLRCWANARATSTHLFGCFTCCPCTGTIYQAIDPAQFITETQFAALQTLTTTAVDNFYFRVDTWTGGFVGPPGRVVDGIFT